MAHISKCRTSANKDQIVFHFSTISTHMFHTENTNSHQFATISILHFESKGPQDFKSKCRNWGPRSRKRRKLGSTSAWLTCKIMQRHDTAAQNRRVVRLNDTAILRGRIVTGTGKWTQSVTLWDKPPDRWSCALCVEVAAQDSSGSEEQVIRKTVVHNKRCKEDAVEAAVGLWLKTMSQRGECCCDLAMKHFTDCLQKAFEEYQKAKEEKGKDQTNRKRARIASG